MPAPQPLGVAGGSHVHAGASPIRPPCLQTPDSSRAQHQGASGGCDPARILPCARTSKEGERSSCTGCSARGCTHYTSSSRVNLALPRSPPISYTGPRAANPAPPAKHVPKHPTCTSQLGDVPAVRAKQKVFHRPCPQRSVERDTPHIPACRARACLSPPVPREGRHHRATTGARYCTTEVPRTPTTQMAQSARKAQRRHRCHRGTDPAFSERWETPEHRRAHWRSRRVAAGAALHPVPGQPRVGSLQGRGQVVFTGCRQPAGRTSAQVAPTVLDTH